MFEFIKAFTKIEGGGGCDYNSNRIMTDKHRTSIRKQIAKLCLF